jgi:hypothetical protein
MRPCAHRKYGIVISLSRRTTAQGNRIVKGGHAISQLLLKGNQPSGYFDCRHTTKAFGPYFDLMINKIREARVGIPDLTDIVRSRGWDASEEDAVPPLSHRPRRLGPCIRPLI